ncbi:uncharacterized protein si:dkey-33c12.4 isoform X2 [Nerophis ophidion]|uniref:uncharacterized protein si:dkey-33c12.4 isoform X2 n=1 Tax=Nerophis ophidion TaxID=159077 RepID=UPI002ADF21BC|nr:uncharacterized protein si:dkey-33c12.4 isoform X2 [Nerophis ophidion]
MRAGERGGVVTRVSLANKPPRRNKHKQSRGNKVWKESTGNKMARRSDDDYKGRTQRLAFREMSSAMSSQSSMFGVRSGRSLFMEALTLRLLGLDFYRSAPAPGFYYDSDEEDWLCSDHFAGQPLGPHPQIRRLTEEEEEKHAKQALIEQKQRESKSARNKRKKLRRNEKKRLEKGAERGEPQEAVQEIGAQAPPNHEADSGDEGSEDQEEGNHSQGKEADGDEPQESVHQIGAQAPPEAEKDNEAQEKGLNSDIAGEVTEKSTDTPDAPRKDRECGSDSEGSHKPALDQKATDPIVEEYMQESAKLAEFGNCWATAGRHDQAIRCFTEAIKLNPKEWKLFGNRSFCYEKTQQYDKALNDAEIALLMEPMWVKGLFRKAKALCGLKRYNDASKVYKEVLKLDGSRREAKEALNHTQMLQLMEMGFTQEESTEALQSHDTLEAAINALFDCDRPPCPAAGADEQDGEWMVQQANKPPTRGAKEVRSSAQSQGKTRQKSDVFQVWVGYLAPTVTYRMLYELFSRVGPVYKVKMLLDQQTAYINYAREEDCAEAIRRIHGMTLEGSTLEVRSPIRSNAEPGMAKAELSDPASQRRWFQRECFFWRTTGCTQEDCTYRHVPGREGIDKDKFNS